MLVRKWIHKIRKSITKHKNRIGNEKIRFTEIGSPQWTRKDLKDSIPAFCEIYKNRPIKNNDGGMKTPHAFAVWFVLRFLKPECIIESGIFKGQGTWLFEKASPHSKIYSIDIDLSKRDYISKTVTYFSKDFAFLNWEQINKEKTLVFFDDHQNAMKRIKFCKKEGFKAIIFEDNYPTGQGDCYSLKQALDRDKEDARFLRRELKVYYEMPPVLRSKMTRWGDDWDNNRYPTAEALFTQVESENLQLFLDEAIDYIWMCYVELK